MASTPVIFKDIFVSQGGMQGDGKAFPQPVGWGGGGCFCCQNFDCLGSDLSTHFFLNVKQAEREGEGFMWSSKAKAQGLGTRPHTDPG